MAVNKYAGGCAACGVVVAIAAGRLIGRPGEWRTFCGRCTPKPPPRGEHDGWHRVPLASLDFETTGVNPHLDRVLSYALLGDDGHDINGLINPGIPIPPQSAAVHGLTAEALADAPTPAIGIALIVDWVQSVIERGAGLVVFNAAYDLTMLRAEATRWGLRQPACHRQPRAQGMPRHQHDPERRQRLHHQNYREQSDHQSRLVAHRRGIEEHAH